MKKEKQTDALQIKFDARNYRKHGQKNKDLIKKSLEELGAGRSVLIDKENSLIAGNGVFEQAQALGIPVRVIETDGSELIAVKRTDLATEDEKRRKLALADNAASDLSEWDVPALQTDWAKEALADLGVEFPEDPIEENKKMIDGVINAASSEIATREFSGDTNYDLTKLYRQKVNEEIAAKIEDGVKAGRIRSEIEDVLRARATQCSIFNFDEICKYYRSADATDEEKELLRRLYLVFVVPREIFENAIEKVREESMKIYDDELMKGTADETD